ncbi:MAG: bifunctional 3,4-dihydroxy-2-butanone-4-phosphate synthase/GTP cyclohydrolase II [Actinobacteria bacterium]|nr:bifunctional 3,4-dihydroxy-2-butanone-4-phosphate synthase/GTP cyclohydrolase II [Actinomycetota bacterium]
MTFAEIPEALEAIRRGEFVVVVDDADRENEGDLIIAAEAVDADKIGFMVRYTSGLICVPMSGERADLLNLPLMVPPGSDPHGTAFTVSVDYTPGTSTGISAADRAATIRALVDPATHPADLARPGHVFPLRAVPGGVLVRAGHTEAAVDLARLAGLASVGALCEVVNDDGSVACLPDLERFAKEHELLLVSIADLISYRRRSERLVRRLSEARIPTVHGEFRAIGFESEVDGTQHVALVMGDVAGKQDVLVRVHSECLTGDVFGSLRCDCGEQLGMAMRMIAAAGEGVLLYCRGHEGRGIGLEKKLAAYVLQEQGRDTVEANLDLGEPVDARDYGTGAQILADLGVTTMRLLTNNPAKRAGLEGHGLRVTEQVPLQAGATPANRAYLQTKATKMGHDIDLG